MKKPKRLLPGDKVAIVSLSSGIGGDPLFSHRYELGKQRLKSEFDLEAVAMPNALKGISHLDQYPEARASDLLEAFADSSIKGIICMTGGDDTIRLMPHIDLNVIRGNPKIFMGYSDTTVNHFMMLQADLVSFYGPTLLSEFAENVAMHAYTKQFIQETLFQINPVIEIAHSPVWTSEFLDWAQEENNQIPRTLCQDEKGYVSLQGSGTVTGKLIGGCLDVFPMIIGTQLWPSLDVWNGAILFLETSEECMSPGLFGVLLRGLAAQGILDRIHGILFAKPMGEKYYEEYHTILQKIVRDEVGRPDLPIMCNVNFGHNAPMCILPYGIQAEINCNARTIRLLESSVTE